MDGAEDGEAGIDALLGGGQVLTGEYDDYDPMAALERIRRGIALDVRTPGPGALPGHPPAGHVPTGPIGPPPGPSPESSPASPAGRPPDPGPADRAADTADGAAAPSAFARGPAAPSDPGPPPPPGVLPPPGWGFGPKWYPTRHEQAAHELGLATALVLGSLQAAESLSRLVNNHAIDPEGALVFACLLHITGRADASRFWWQFAAGAGSYTAASCLYLHHRSAGEFRDADYWRRQAHLLAARPAREHAPIRYSGPPLLPDPVRRDILNDCRNGRSPRLPLALEAVMNRLPVACDDDDYGEVPQPSPDLATALARPGKAD